MVSSESHKRHLDNAESNAAAWAAARGAVTGAARWGLLGAAFAGVAYTFSPVYRTLTFQFKVFLQMSAMTFGSMVEADQRLRAHEALVRRDKKLKRDAEVWRKYQDEYVRRAVESNERQDGE